MRRFLLLLLTAVLLATACSTARRVSSATPSWVGASTFEILDAMGNPVRIEDDGKGGSVLTYESTPDYNDPKYDILDPEASAENRKFADFYLDPEGVCYQVDTNMVLPTPPQRADLPEQGGAMVDCLITIALFLVFLL